MAQNLTQKTFSFFVFLLSAASLLAAPESYTPNPLKIDIKTSGKSVSRALSGKGGTIEATFSGVQYKLVIPEKALIAPQRITMAEIQSYQNMPTSGAQPLGVILKPQGLELLKEATLTITDGASSLEKLKDNAKRLVGFGFKKEGEDFYLAPASQKSEQSVQVTFNHFSGHGVTSGTDAEIQQQAQNHPPKDVRGYTQQGLATNPSTAALRGLYETHYAESNSWIIAAKSNPGFMEQAFSYFQNWTILYDGAPAGIKTLFASKNAQLLTDIIVAFNLAINEAQVKCITHDLYQIKRLLRFSMLVLEHPLISTGFPSPGEIRNKAVKCAHFKLRVSTKIHDGEQGSDYLFSATAGGTIDIKPTFVSLGGFHLRGSGFFDYTDTDFDSLVTNDDCTLNMNTVGGDANVNGMTLGLNINTAGTDPSSPGKLPVNNIVVSLLPSANMQENAELRCPVAPPFPLKYKIWSGGWYTVHQDQMNRDPQSALGAGAFISNWVPNYGGPIVAKKKVSRSIQGFTEESEYELIHTPKL